MALESLATSATLQQVYEGMRRVLSESKTAVCGLVLASCKLDQRQLERLESEIGLKGDVYARYLYEPRSGVLAVLCGGMKLVRTHYMALELREFLYHAAGNKGGVIISSFNSPGGFDLMDIDAMLHRLAGEASEGAKIQIYNRHVSGDKLPTVLIIDDDEAGGEFLNNRLQMKGYEVYQAYDGLQGVRLCEEIAPDVVITELTLPVYDGFQVIRKLQQSDAVDSKIVVLSERRMEQDVSACFRMGVADYVKKPYSPVELEARLRRLLS